MILITRPKDQGTKTLKRLTGLGYKAKLHPLLKIESDLTKIHSIHFEQYDILIITSQNTAEIILKSQLVWDKPAYIVGFKTAEILKNIFINIKEVCYNAESLFLKITENEPNTVRILYLSGEHYNFDFAKMLNNKNYNIDQEKIYKAVACSNITEHAISNVKTILFYSARTAEIFAKNNNYNLKHIDAICISPNCAAKINHLSFNNILIAEKPDENEMLKCLGVNIYK